MTARVDARTEQAVSVRPFVRVRMVERLVAKVGIDPRGACGGHRGANPRKLRGWFTLVYIYIGLH